MRRQWLSLSASRSSQALKSSTSVSPCASVVTEFAFACALVLQHAAQSIERRETLDSTASLSRMVARVASLTARLKLPRRESDLLFADVATCEGGSTETTEESAVIVVLLIGLS
mmetsp:Transcript_546/g.1948  ORF Transcript_546/g.1948 Transcript_546/m.1948 type:complete len:114 (+) Transcript_546:371-712(+)